MKSKNRLLAKPGLVNPRVACGLDTGLGLMVEGLVGGDDMNCGGDGRGGQVLRGFVGRWWGKGTTISITSQS